MPGYTTPRGEPAAFITCRTLGHAWDSIPIPAGTDRPGGAVPIWLRCTRCTTERHDLVNPFSGAVDGRAYQYATGYEHSRDESLDRATWRATYLRLVGAISDRQAREGRKYRRDLWEGSQ